MQQFRDNQLQVTQEGVNEKNLIETMKQEKVEQDVAILRNLIAVAERKVLDEGGNRVSGLDEIRNYFE